jgi:hypothetical protein
LPLVPPPPPRVSSPHATASRNAPAGCRIASHHAACRSCEQGTSNNEKAPLSALTPPSLSHERRIIVIPMRRFQCCRHRHCHHTSRGRLMMPRCHCLYPLACRSCRCRCASKGRSTLLRCHRCYPLTRRCRCRHCTSRGRLTMTRRHHCYPLARHRHCHRRTSKVRPTMPLHRCQRCHHHCRRRCCASEGGSTMLRRHQRYPPMCCCRRHRCTSRVQPTAQRRRCHHG